jgi:hypothetical protein
MTSKYNCIPCEYKTNLNNNYNKHIRTNKHINLVKICQINLSSNGKKLSSNGKNLSSNGKKSNVFCCKFCNKSLSSNRRLNTHYGVCIQKKITENDKIVQTINIEKENIQKKTEKKLLEKEDIIKKKEDIIKEKEDIIKQKELSEKGIEEMFKKYIMDTSSTINKLISQQTTVKVDNNVSNMNIFYIANNFDDALNYEDVMGEKLTKSEVKDILDNGPTVGCYNLIRNRCIINLSKNKRPIHCTDFSRDKYVVRSNDVWVPDWSAVKILAEAFKPVREVMYTENNRKDINIHKLVKNQGLLLEMDTTGGKKIMKHLGKEILIKNKTYEKNNNIFNKKKNKSVIKKIKNKNFKHDKDNNKLLSSIKLIE